MDKKKIAELVSKIGDASASLTGARNDARRFLRDLLSKVGKVEFPKYLVENLSGNELDDLADSLERQSVAVTVFPDTATSEISGFVSAIRSDKNEEETFVDILHYRNGKVAAFTCRIHEVVEQEKLLDFVNRFSE